jgi:1-acyl-sn-glycerol-3-phosphate acyltransferase|tara:strand:+ start:14342 stop:14581 length:240 start_codon:yes stop_codon:yes gene_type:complete
MTYLPLAAKIAKDYGVTDMADGMRVEMLAMAIDGSNHTLESLKKTPGYLCTVNDFNFTDEYLQGLLDWSSTLTSITSKF